MTQDHPREILTQLDRLETLVKEGRRPVREWGYLFAFNGIVHICCIIYSFFWSFEPELLWFIVIGLPGLGMTGYGLAIRRRYEKQFPFLDRAVAGIWAAFGIATGILWVFGKQPPLNINLVLFAFCILTGVAHFASSRVLMLRLQAVNAILWWIGAVLVIRVPVYTSYIFLGLAFFGEVCFGGYLMLEEQRQKAGHAPSRT